MKHLYKQTPDISSISHSEQGQTKLHCHQVMRLSCDAVFAKVKDRHGDDDNRCGRRNEPLQGGFGQTWQECGADVRDGPHQGENMQFFWVSILFKALESLKSIKGQTS